MAPNDDDADHPAFPPRYGEALESVRAAIARCEAKQIAAGSIVAALVTEMMPRLVSTYGPAGAASALGDLAGFIASGREPARLPH